METTAYGSVTFNYTLSSNFPNLTALQRETRPPLTIDCWFFIGVVYFKSSEANSANTKPME
jgi:hypothetical protein